jgi:hypothetical protein
MLRWTAAASFYDVVAGHPGPAVVGQGERGQDAEGGGLACPVRPEDAEDGPGWDLQVDAGQGDGGTKPLGQPFGFDHRRTHWRLSLLVN